MEKNIHQDEKDTSVNEEIESQEVNAEESTETNQDDNVVGRKNERRISTRKR